MIAGTDIFSLALPLAYCSLLRPLHGAQTTGSPKDRPSPWFLEVLRVLGALYLKAGFTVPPGKKRGPHLGAVHWPGLGQVLQSLMTPAQSVSAAFRC